jgi:hypothetical protein
MTIDHESEYEAAYTAATALWDGLTEREMREALELAGLEGGCETRWEMLAYLDDALGANLRAAI